MKVEQFRNECDFLFDAINVHRHSCVGASERKQWLANTQARLARVRDLFCPRAKIEDVQRWQDAIAQTEAVLSTYSVMVPPVVPAQNYIKSQLSKIEQPRLNHIAGTIKIKGDVGGETKWLNISADQLEAIANILQSMPSNNS